MPVSKRNPRVYSGSIKPAVDEECLVRRVAAEAEAHDEYILPLHLDLLALLTLVGNLQLSLRHPANTGPSALAARQIIEQIIERLREDGLTAHAELATLGNDPQFDL